MYTAQVKNSAFTNIQGWLQQVMQDLAAATGLFSIPFIKHNKCIFNTQHNSTA